MARARPTRLLPLGISRLVVIRMDTRWLSGERLRLERPRLEHLRGIRGRSGILGRDTKLQCGQLLVRARLREEGLRLERLGLERLRLRGLRGEWLRCKELRL